MLPCSRAVIHRGPAQGYRRTGITSLTAFRICCSFPCSTSSFRVRARPLGVTSLLFGASRGLYGPTKGSKHVAREGDRIIGFAHWVTAPMCQFSPSEKLRLLPAMVGGLGSWRGVARHTMAGQLVGPRSIGIARSPWANRRRSERARQARRQPVDASVLRGARSTIATGLPRDRPTPECPIL
jgi:hypothetical protein